MSVVDESLAMVRRYLEELRDSGVDGLPLGLHDRQEPAPQPQELPAIQAAVPEASGAEAPQGSAESLVPAVGTETLEDIRAVLGDCHRCQLGDQRTNLVYGVGSPRARVVFVGEAPGRDEDLQGEPFVGEAGQLLTKIIQAMGLQRQDVYICNVLKCRPPGNRNPQPEEVEACSPYMLRQVKAIGPEVVVALGTFAAQTLLQSREPISKLRGQFHDYHGIPLMPTFHPAFLLRSPEKKREVWIDIKLVMERLGLAIPAAKGKE